MDTATQITPRLENQRLEDLFIGAFEGGSAYWCGISSETLNGLRPRFKTEARPCASEYVWDAILAGESVEFFDQESDDTWTLNLDKIKEGTEKMVLEHPQHYANALTNFDAETSDVWLQLCLLGEITFG